MTAPMNMKKYIAFLLLPLLVGGCKTLQDLANSIQKPSLSVDNVRVTGFNFQQMELTYDIKVENPNSVEIGRAHV